MKRALAASAAVIAMATAAPAAGEPYGPGPGMCSFRGRHFVQWYPCTQPPAWLFQPGISSADARPGIGTTTSPYS